MLETMYHFNGVGLAAVQVGILKQIYIYSLNEVYDIKNVAIICVGIFAVVYVGNYIYQRIMVSRLNKELNK